LLADNKIHQFCCYLLYKCPEEHRFQAAGNERKKERILIERMKERKQEKEKERKKERREKERKIPANCRVDQLLVIYKKQGLTQPHNFK
jgi:hypothetical protein